MAQTEAWKLRRQLADALGVADLATLRSKTVEVEGGYAVVLFQD